LLVDPSLYADHSIEISIAKVGGGLGGPVVSELMLTDVRYCYRDSGVQGEISFADASDGCGWLNGIADQSWGTLPYQSVRYQDFSSVDYRFDGLESTNDYRLNLTFYQNDSPQRIENVLIDGVTALSNILLSNTPKYVHVDVPAATYTDGSINASITHTSQPVISEISLEQKTITESGIEPQAYADLSIIKTDSADPILAGSPLQYRITVTNNGPHQASNVTVIDTLPSGVSLVSTSVSQGTGCSGLGSLACNVGSISPNQSATVTINVMVNENLTGLIDNTATVVGDIVDINSNNNSASQTTTVNTHNVQYFVYLPVLMR